MRLTNMIFTGITPPFSLARAHNKYPAQSDRRSRNPFSVQKADDPFTATQLVFTANNQEFSNIRAVSRWRFDRSRKCCNLHRKPNITGFRFICSEGDDL